MVSRLEFTWHREFHNFSSSRRRGQVVRVSRSPTSGGRQCQPSRKPAPSAKPSPRYSASNTPLARAGLCHRIDELEHAIWQTLDRIRERDGVKIFREVADRLADSIAVAACRASVYEDFGWTEIDIDDLKARSTTAVRSSRRRSFCAAPARSMMSSVKPRKLG
jgi:hypothetical protein